MFALGSVLFTIYALNVAHAKDQATADEFLQVSGGLPIVYGIGNMVESQLAGRLGRGRISAQPSRIDASWMNAR